VDITRADFSLFRRTGGWDPVGESSEEERSSGELAGL